MLDLVYFSNVSNNTHRFVTHLEWATGDIHRVPIKGEFEGQISNPYVLICPSYGDEKNGHVPPQVRKFLNQLENRKNCVGVIGSGHINFGDEFAKAGDILATKLRVPLLYKFELAGTQHDIERVREGLATFDGQLVSSNA